MNQRGDKLEEHSLNRPKWSLHREGMSEEFSFRSRGDSSGTVRTGVRWERGRSKASGDIFGEMPETLEELILARF